MLTEHRSYNQKAILTLEKVFYSDGGGHLLAVTEELSLTYDRL